MGKALRCDYCDAELDPAQELLYWFEVQNTDDPETLAHYRRLPASYGIPLLVCRKCHASLDANTRWIADEESKWDADVRRFWSIVRVAVLLLLAAVLARMTWVTLFS